MVRLSATSLRALIVGFLLSIIALYASDPICDYLQARRLEKVGLKHAQGVCESVELRLKSLQSLSEDLAAIGDVDGDTFSNLADPVVKKWGISSVEWAPLVLPGDRAAFEADLETELGAKRQLMTYRDGRTITIPYSEPVRPTRYIHPYHPETQKHIGFQRGRWAAMVLATRSNRPYLSPSNRFYSASKVSSGVFVSVGDVDEVHGPRAMLFATLNDLFPMQVLSGNKTKVVARDVTPNDYRPNASDNDNHRALTRQSITPSKLSCIKQIGGRLYEFDVTESTLANLRPVWIPWSLFFLCNALATLAAIRVHRKETTAAIAANRELEKEIDRRIAANKQLQATLDFRDQERELIAHDIHDGFVQDIIGAQMFIESLTHSLPADSSQRETAAQAGHLLAAAIEDVRRTIEELKPRVVDEVGLVPAINASIDEDNSRYPFRTTFQTATDFPRLPIVAERMLYRIVREGIVNARQHSGASRAVVVLGVDRESITIEIADQGDGFDVDEIGSDCFGIAGIRHRVEVLNGTMDLRSSEFGTKIAIEIPLNLQLPSFPVSNSSLALNP